MSFLNPTPRVTVTYRGSRVHDWMRRNYGDVTSATDGRVGRFVLLEANLYGDHYDPSMTLVPEAYGGEFATNLEAMEVVTEALSDLPDADILDKCKLNIDIEMSNRL